MDPVYAILCLRKAEDAAKALIAHATGCPHCDGDKLCERGRQVSLEYRVADELAQPFVIFCKQRTGELTPAQA